MTSNIVQIQVPQLKKENYKKWCNQFKVLFESQDLWEIVSIGFVEPTPEQETNYSEDDKATLKDQRKKDKQALYLLYQGFDDSTFEKIAEAATSKAAWDTLNTIFKGDDRVKRVRGCSNTNDHCPSQNDRNIIILVAIFIATVTFSAGISPPRGGVDDQDGKMEGTAVTVGRATAFQVFEMSNSIALFTSLSIVIVLVSIIPFGRKALMTLLWVAQKVMWVSVASMATGYVAATWIVMPQDEGTNMLFVMLIVVNCGILGVIFIYLAVKLVEYWLSQMKWEKQTRDGGERRVSDPGMETQNSNAECSYDAGE